MKKKRSYFYGLTLLTLLVSSAYSMVAFAEETTSTGDSLSLVSTTEITLQETSIEVTSTTQEADETTLSTEVQPYTTQETSQTETAESTSASTTETSVSETTTTAPTPTTSTTEFTTSEEVAQAVPEAATSRAIYRLYNPSNGEHLYTTDANEKNVLYSKHGWGYEGVGWYAPTKGTPVYRLYNAKLQNHLYTTDRNEVKVLTSRYGWTSDNGGKPVFYSGGKVKIYRVYNPKLRGLHHWTTDANEYKVLPKHGWRQEGVKFTGVKNGQPIKTKYAQTGMNIHQIAKGDFSSVEGYWMNGYGNVVYFAKNGMRRLPTFKKEPPLRMTIMGNRYISGSYELPIFIYPIEVTMLPKNVAFPTFAGKRDASNRTRDRLLIYAHQETPVQNAKAFYYYYGKSLPKSPKNAKMNLTQIAKGDFSSVAGTWVNTSGDVVIFDKSGPLLMKGIKDWKLMQYTIWENNSLSRGWNSPIIGGGVVFLPKGVVASKPHPQSGKMMYDPSDSRKERLLVVVGQYTSPEDEERFYFYRVP